MEFHIEATIENDIEMRAADNVLLVWKPKKSLYCYVSDKVQAPLFCTMFIHGNFFFPHPFPQLCISIHVLHPVCCKHYKLWSRVAFFVPCLYNSWNNRAMSLD